MRSYLAAFVLATLVAAFATPIVRRIALRLGAVSATGGRNVNVRAIPRLGGVGIALALFAPIVALLFVESSVVAELLRGAIPKVVGLLVGGVIICAVGVVDDTRGMRALHKLYVQVGVGVLAFFCGFRIDIIDIPLIGDFVHMGIFALPVTVIWVVGIINAVNLIDGLDGLAAGVAFFAAFTNFVVAFMNGHFFTALVMASLLGALLGFLFYNFNPAKIFMGDSGSYLLGYVIAVGGLAASQKASTAVSLLVPVVALGVPIFDTLFAMVRRILERRPIFSPDRGHIHHRLLDLGLTHRRAVLVLYGVSVLFTALSMVIYLGRDWQVGVALVVASAVFIGMARFAGNLSLANIRKRQQQRVRSRDTELIRRALPETITKLNDASSEEELLDLLGKLAETTELASVEVVRMEGAEVIRSWGDDDEDKRRMVAYMTYPIGRDGLALARVRIGAVNDLEDPEMPPQTEILLQVVVDVLAQNLTRLRSDLAPRTTVDPEPASTVSASTEPASTSAASTSAASTSAAATIPARAAR